MTFIKLSATEKFTIEKVHPLVWQKYDKATKTFDKSDTFIPGYDMAWNVDTDQGTLTISRAQMSQLLSAYVEEGKVDIVGKSYTVKMTDKEYMENGEKKNSIRYFINGVYNEPATAKDVKETLGDTGMPY